MNILNQPGAHPAFPAAKDTGAFQLMPASVRFDGPSTAHTHRSTRWQAQTLRRSSSYVGSPGADEDVAPANQQAALAAPFQPVTLNFLRSLLDKGSMTAIATDEDGGKGAAEAAPPPPLCALRVVVSSAVALDARQTELIARKMRRITGFVHLLVENVVDPSLIAGFVISYGLDDSHAIDLSVRARLAALKNRVDSFDHHHDDRLHPRPHTPFH
ncbi:ATP synthase subunit delta, chloroplastic-like [Lolium rigidum]|uniref:ATP synthase subunit delta, chloroplastic-like n=1 Tax=Lolium rigidum TaxID=89674 RepID=UPI001F5E1F41|nr:ATP synthase subunit delta, chloroplastic-like [Lolium rigidum]